nr:mucin-16 isoform X24 [Syngnathus scovelli]XP_049612705.1 mucin-16 isoform X25 [Syngnathus scovelli]XP_049612706.1 mucin-16 isoform X26 [Syngnathus scovelli]
MDSSAQVVIRMAIHKNGLVVVLLLAMFCILKTGHIIKLSSVVSLHQVHSEEQHPIREKRELGSVTHDAFFEGTTETTFTTKTPVTIVAKTTQQTTNHVMIMQSPTAVINTPTPETTSVTHTAAAQEPTPTKNTMTTQPPTNVINPPTPETTSVTHTTAAQEPTPTKNTMTTQPPTNVINPPTPETTSVTHTTAVQETTPTKNTMTTQPPTNVINTPTPETTSVTHTTAAREPTPTKNTMTTQPPTNVINTPTPETTSVTHTTAAREPTPTKNTMTTQPPTNVINTPTPETTSVTHTTAAQEPTPTKDTMTTQPPTNVINTPTPETTSVTHTTAAQEPTPTKNTMTTQPPTNVINTPTPETTSVTHTTEAQEPTPTKNTMTTQPPTAVINTPTPETTSVTHTTAVQETTPTKNTMTTQPPTNVINTPTPETTSVTHTTAAQEPTPTKNTMTTQPPTNVINTLTPETTSVTHTTAAQELTPTKNTMTTQPPTNVINTPTPGTTSVTHTTAAQEPTPTKNTMTTQSPTTVTNTPTPETTTVTHTTATQELTLLNNTMTTQSPTTVTNTTTQSPTTVTNGTTTQAPTTAANTMTTQSPTTVTNTPTPETTTVTHTIATQEPTPLNNTMTTQSPTTVTNTTTQSPTTVTNGTTTQAPTTAANTMTTQSPTTVTNTPTPETTTVTHTTATQEPTLLNNTMTTQSPTTVTNTTTQSPTTVTNATTTQAPTTVTNIMTTQSLTTLTNTPTHEPVTGTKYTTTGSLTTVAIATTTQAPTTVTNTTTTLSLTTLTNATTTQAPTTVTSTMTMQSPTTNTTTPKTTVTTTMTTQSSTTVTNAATTQAPTTVTNTTKTTSPPFDYEYLISVELNVTELSTITFLRNILKNTSYPIDINSILRISDINITTVCNPSNGDFQCGCEDQYRWSCDQCLLHGSCDHITNDTCGCINAIPPFGQYCQSIDQYNFPACPPTTPSPITTSPPFDYEYLISVELNVTDMSVITSLRNILKNTSYPIDVNSYLKISDINMTTVCSPSNGDFQCRCEDQYRWPCDQCLLHGSCDSITNNTCGCIEAIPLDGQYCQSVDEHNTFCPSTTPFPTTLYTTVATSSPTTPVTNATTQSPSSVTNTTTRRTKTVTNTTTAKNTTTQPPPPPPPPTIPKNQPSTTTTSTTSTTPPDSPQTTPGTVLQLDYSIRFDRVYTSDLSDKNSSAHKDLASQIRAVLLDQYGGLTGFVDAIVTGFRPGSVVADFIVQASQVDPEDLSVVNQGLPDAMQPIAKVLGLVALYRSPTQFITPRMTYTGRSIELTCGPTPAGIDLGNIIGTKWKLNGQELKESGRIEISSSATASVLKVRNVILADAGRYECNRIGSALTFVQDGRAINIRQAPNVRVPSKLNVKCTEGRTQLLKCCVQSNFIVRWFLGGSVLESGLTDLDEVESYCISHRYVLRGCENLPSQLRFTCRVNNPVGFEQSTTMVIFKEVVVCDDELYGTGRTGDVSTIACDSGQEGSRSATCRDTGEWIIFEDTCIVSEIKDLLVASEDLEEVEVPQLAANLSQIVQVERQQIVNSSATISAVVGILSAIANVSNEVNQTVMQDVLETVDILIGDDARETWEFLRENITRNDSSQLLNSMEILADELIGEFTIQTELILLNTSTFNDSFTAEFNNSVVIDIPGNDRNNLTITTIVFSTLDNVLPPRNSSFNNTFADTTNTSAIFDTAINAAVALVRVNTNIQNITVSFKKQNDSLTQNPQCVFWNFTLVDYLGAWDDQGCTLVSDINNTVTCNCNHLTSFSILMATDIPESIRIALDVITYVGVGISIASLIICLIIEAYVWKALTKSSTAFMRHVCIINTALSLLIADICFIIAAFYAKNPLENPDVDHEVPLGPCTTATFFLHFFYLALFFWMLASGLLLFYRTILVFSHMSKSAMMAIAFLFGYVCPLIIAVVTVAATAPGNGYIRENDACWLNWTKTKALLALVIPALTIVFINFVIVIVITFKMLRRGTVQVTRPDEKHSLVVIARCVIILTPLFGLTWGLGVGTMISSTNEGIHIAFAFFNSLQGFFILVFGTLLDSKIRALLSKKLPALSSGSGSNQTASTSAGVSTSSAPNWFQKLRGKRYVYRVSEAVNTSSSSGTESYSNI